MNKRSVTIEALVSDLESAMYVDVMGLDDTVDLSLWLLKYLLAHINEPDIEEMAEAYVAEFCPDRPTSDCQDK